MARELPVTTDLDLTTDASLVLTAPPDAPSLIPAPRPTAEHSLVGKNVVVIGINYAPEPTGIAPYTTGMVEHLAEHAQHVNVLTGVPHYPDWKVPAPYRRRLRTREQAHRSPTGEVIVRRLRHYVPRKQTALTRAAYEATFMAHLSTMRTAPPPDVVLAVTPSLGGAVAGAQLARRYQVPLVIVVQDLMAKAASESGISGGGRVSQITARMERKALLQADRVAIVSDAFRGQLHEYGVPDERIELLPNWSHVTPSRLGQDAARRSLSWPTEPFTVVHTGNIGLKQDLGNVVEAARLLVTADPSVRFVIVGDGSQRAVVMKQAEGLTNVAFVDPLSPLTYPDALAAADLLLVNERPSVGDMSLPSKLTSYLVAGRPVIAAASHDGATARELATTDGAGVLVNPGNPRLLAETIQELHAGEISRAAMGAAGQRYAQRELSSAAAMARLDAILTEAMGSRP